jgi:hypothetical protein
MGAKQSVKQQPIVEQDINAEIKRAWLNLIKSIIKHGDGSNGATARKQELIILLYKREKANHKSEPDVKAKRKFKALIAALEKAKAKALEKAKAKAIAKARAIAEAEARAIAEAKVAADAADAAAEANAIAEAMGMAMTADAADAAAATLGAFSYSGISTEISDEKAEAALNAMSYPGYCCC